MAKKNDDRSGIFAPAGLLIGLGMDFLFGTLPAYLFVGLGLGLLVMAAAKYWKP